MAVDEKADAGTPDWVRTMAALTHDRGGVLKRNAFLLCGSDADADDLAQEALVRAFARAVRRGTAGAEAHDRLAKALADPLDRDNLEVRHGVRP